MKVAVIGAGIVGACSAWSLARRGHHVALFERDSAMAHTSRSSSKLLHGGLRYLENGQFSLVKKSLQARRFWIEQAPHLCQPIELLLPVYHKRGRKPWQIYTGLKLYDFLACGSNFPKSKWLNASETLRQIPELESRHLLGAFSFYDAQMDDFALGQWVIEQFRQLGGKLYEQHPIHDLTELEQFDRIINATGPWVMHLRNQQNSKSAYTIDWVRGSHIVIDRITPKALFLQVPHEERIFFALPHQGKTLIGTTEIRQFGPDTEGMSGQEADYLISAYNAYFKPKAQLADIELSFSGVRPLIRSNANPSKATREWAFERVGKTLHIYGGKWTTAQIQGEAACQEILK